MQLINKSRGSRRRNFALLCAAAGAFGPLTCRLHADTTATWDGTNNNWSSALDWSSNPFYPNNGTPSGTLYDAVVNNGTITLDVNPTVQLLDLTGGTISGTHSLTAGGLFTWSGGTIENTVKANGGINFSGGSDDFLNGGTLTNALGQSATIGASGNIYLYMENGGTFTNAGTLTASNGAIAYNGGSNTVNNTGTFNVNEPAGTFTVGSSLTFNNSGAVNVQAGTLALQASDSGSTSGSFDVSSGAVLSFQGNYTLATPSSVSGAGTVNFSSGTQNINGTYNITGSSAFTGGDVTFNSPIVSLGSGPLVVSSGSVDFGTNAPTVSTMTVSGGTISGSGTVTAGGLFTWSGGTIENTVKANGGINFSGGSDDFLNGGTLTNALGQSATIGASGNIYLYMENGGTFTNAGTLTASNGAIAYNGGSNTVNNTGTFNVNEPAGTFTVGSSLTFNNSGAVNVQAGTLALQASYSGTSSGALSVPAGTMLSFQGAFTQIAAFTNNGTLQVDATGTSGQISGTGKLDVIGGSLKLAAGSGTSAQSGLIISGGHLDITNNTLVINFPSGADPASTIRGYLASGYNNDAWTGPGIVSSNAAADPGLYAVGYADGGRDAGTPAGATQIIIKNTLAGDANLDGIVNFADLLVVAQNFNHTLDTHGNPIDWADGDFNYDGVVNFADLLLVAQNFNRSLSASQMEQLPGSFSAAWNLALAEVQLSNSNNVPEPAAISLAILAAAILLPRRRRTGAPARIPSSPLGH
jgi:hypothetical protein